MTLASTRTSVSLEVFGPSLAEARRANKYIGRENHFSVILNANGTYTIRAHDEYTAGGRDLAVSLPAPLTIGPGETLPACVPPGVQLILVECDLSTGDLDLTDVAFTPDCPTVELRFRKIDFSTNALLYNDPIGISYSFAATRGEMVGLLWDSSKQATTLI